MNTLEQAIEELNRIYLEKYYKEKTKQYVMTKPELVKFCKELLKIIIESEK